MANFKSSWTSTQIEQAITDALAIAEAETETAVDGVTYHIIWKVAPTDENIVFGLTTSPVDGQLYKATSNKKVITLTAFDPNSLDIAVDGTKLVISK